MFNQFTFSYIFKRMFAQCIHAQIMVNVFRKEIVDDVFVHHPITVMIVEMVMMK